MSVWLFILRRFAFRRIECGIDVSAADGGEGAAAGGEGGEFAVILEIAAGYAEVDRDCEIGKVAGNGDQMGGADVG